MKVTIEKPENEKQEIVYPCLMLSPDRDYVLLLTTQSMGVVIESKYKEFHVGMYSDCWEIDHFTPLPKGTKVIITQ